MGAQSFAADPSPDKLQKILADKPDNILARVQLAEIRLGEKKYGEVIELLNSYTDQLRGSGFRVLAFAYGSMGDHSNEVRVLKIVADKEPENFEWHLLLAQAHLKQAALISEPTESRNTITSAIQELRKVLKIKPGFKVAFDLLLKTFLEQKNHNEARELIAEGLDKFGGRPDLYRELCRLNAIDGFLPQALQACTQSIELSPNYPDHYVFLVQVLMDQKEAVSAEKKIVYAAKKFPKSEFVQWAAGKLFLKKQNYPVATRYFETAIRVKPDSSRGQIGLAEALYESGREAEALPHYEIACKADPSTADDFLTAGGRLKQGKNPSLGQKYMSAAYKCRP
ncbi:MAG: tetratricopeptide repeat protein [Bdellovibrionales bacterium]